MKSSIVVPIKVFVRSPYNYDRGLVSDQTGLACNDKSMTQQNQKDEADINTIVKRFGLTGKLPDNVKVPQYGDFTGVVDYHSAMNVVIAADEAFMRMPAGVRERFENDPGKFVDFVLNPSNREEAAKLGLLVPEAVKPSQEPQAAIAPAGKPEVAK